jgi:hypothetical protein
MYGLSTVFYGAIRSHFKGKFMARPATQRRSGNDTDAPITAPDDNMLDAFKSALGSMGNAKVTVHYKKLGPNNTFGFVNTFDMAAEGFTELIDDLRKMYPEGGVLRLRLLDDGGKFKSQSDMTLAPIPLSERDRLSLPAASSSGAGNELMIAMMQMANQNAQAQAQQSANMMQMMMQNSQSQQASLTTMLAAIIPAIASNKGESDGELLRNLTAAQKDLMPAKDDNSMEKMFTMLKVAKELMPDNSGGGGDGDGFAGLASKALPLFAALAQGANQQAQLQPQQMPPQTMQQRPPQIAAPQPNPQAQPAPAPIQQPAQPAEQQDAAMLAQMQLIQTYDPVMKAVKKLLEKGHDAEQLCDYIEAQIEAEVITETDFEMLITGLATQPDMLPHLLGFWGINAPEHIATVSECVRLFSTPEPEMDADDDSAGNEGDETNPDDNGGASH